MNCWSLLSYKFVGLIYSKLKIYFAAMFIKRQKLIHNLLFLKNHCLVYYYNYVIRRLLNILKVFNLVAI